MMGLGDVLKAEAEQVKVNVLGQSQHYTFVDVMKPQVDQVNKKVTMHVRFMYNSMPVVFTVENLLNSVNPEVVQKSVGELGVLTKALARMLAMYLDYKVGDYKVYSILYNAGRGFQFVLPVRFTTNRVVEYSINVRKGKGDVYSNNLKFVSGQLLMKNTLAKLSNGNLSNPDKITMTLVQNITRDVFGQLTQNQVANKLVSFYTQVFRGVGYLAFMDNRFVGSMSLLLRVLYNSQGIDPQRSTLTVVKGGENYVIPAVKVIALYQNAGGGGAEKLKETVVRVYTNQIQ